MKGTVSPPLSVPDHIERPPYVLKGDGKAPWTDAYQIQDEEVRHVPGSSWARKTLSMAVQGHS